MELLFESHGTPPLFYVTANYDNKEVTVFSAALRLSSTPEWNPRNLFSS